MAALVRRAVTLAAISDWQYRNLMVEMSTLGYRTHEPGDLARERPDKVTTIVERLTHAQGLDRVAVTAGLLPEEFRRLYLSDAAQDGDSPDADTVHEVHR